MKILSPWIQLEKEKIQYGCGNTFRRSLIGTEYGGLLIWDTKEVIRRWRATPTYSRHDELSDAQNYCDQYAMANGFTLINNMKEFQKLSILL